MPALWVIQIVLNKCRFSGAGLCRAPLLSWSMQPSTVIVKLKFQLQLPLGGVPSHRCPMGKFVFLTSCSLMLQITSIYKVPDFAPLCCYCEHSRTVSPRLCLCKLIRMVSVHLSDMKITSNNLEIRVRQVEFSMAAAD